MKLIDLNILLYAINENSTHHVAVRTWWEQALNGDEPLGLPWVVFLGFLRISTNPDIFPRPLDPDTAIRKVHTWLLLDNMRLLCEQNDHWEILKSLLNETGTAANLVTDAHLAALAISHHAVLVSCDNDFARFKRLRWENPLGHKPPRRP